MNAAFRRFERQQRLARLDRWLRQLHDKHPFQFLLLVAGVGVGAGVVVFGLLALFDWLSSRGGNL